MVKRCVFILIVVVLLINNISASTTMTSFNSGQPYFYPVREQMLTQSLNGTWKFKLIDGLNITSEFKGWEMPDFDVSQWDNIIVPGNWETQGFKIPEYGKDLEEYTGLYRTTFKYNPTWSGKHVILRFDGVHFGYECYINGTKVGEFGSAFNLCQFDITPYLKTEVDNVLSVKVSTRSFGWLFDTNDCWSLTGITRDVELFTLDNVYLEDVTYTSDVTPDLDATIKIRVDINRFKEYSGRYKLNLSLSDPLNKHVADFSEILETGKNTYQFEGQLEHPKLWTAETPNLYRLEVCIIDNTGRVIQRINERVGVRSICVDGFDFKVNHTPIFLRGICLNEIHAKSGRALTYKERRQQLEMMKAANINFIRTAHYPFAPDFLQLCDEMGFYVCNEIPFGSRGSKNLDNIEYLPELLGRADVTLRRDKNHPSVIIWSLGNENPYTPIVEEVLKFVKAKDPGRPRGLPQKVGDFLRFSSEPSENVDVIMGHYLNDTRISEAIKNTQKPIIHTEYAHSLGLSFDDLEARYARILQEDKVIGGSIWCWGDQTVVTDGKNQEGDIVKGVWIDSNRFMDSYARSNVPDGKAEIAKEGADGIVYGDGYPQEDYFLVRKVYSPVVIEAENLTGELGVSNHFKIEAENRFDFISLHGYRMNWQLRNIHRVLDSGNIWLQAAAKQKEQISIEANLPGEVEYNDLMLCIEVFDPSGKVFYEKSLPIEITGREKDYRSLITSIPPSKKNKIIVTKTNVSLDTDNLRFTVSDRGILTITDEDNSQIAQTPLYLRVGRLATITLDHQARKNKWFRDPYILTPLIDKFESSRLKEGVQVRLSCRWNRDKDSNQYISGVVTMHILPNGVMQIDYNIQPPANISDSFLECGLTLKLDPSFDVFRWLGAGPFSYTPGKTAYNERNCHALHKNDLRFIGNRGLVDIAVVTDHQRGVGLWSDNGNLSIENIDGSIFVSQDVIVAGYGSKFTKPKDLIPADKLKSIQGTLILFVDQSPKPIIWFDSIFKPYRTVVPEQPYLRSYGW